MNYRIMKILCMFDLPTETEKDKRAYRIFRKNLIKEGFRMVQYSIYAKTCVSRESAAGVVGRIRKYVPDQGNIRLLTVTEKQYEDMILLVGSKKVNEEKVGSKRLIIL